MEMKFCNAHGLPHSSFLNWEPSDRAKAIATEYELSLFCQSCGTAPWQWEDDKYAFEVVDEICQGCHHLEYMQDSKASAPGHKLNLAPTKTMASARRAVAAQNQYLNRGGGG